MKSVLRTIREQLNSERPLGQLEFPGYYILFEKFHVCYYFFLLRLRKLQTPLGSLWRSFRDLLKNLGNYFIPAYQLRVDNKKKKVSNSNDVFEEYNVT